tara:strand:+ start:147 stop:1631 length:1485 start_codon:yes stop_codon:yes gene_type:complete
METLQRTANRGSVSTGPYEIDNSLKFDSASTEYLYKTRDASGSDWNRLLWTASMWVKHIPNEDTSTAPKERMFGAADANNDFDIRFRGQPIGFRNNSDVDGVAELRTTAVYRDYSAWYHVVAVWDTANSTAGDRMKLYVNGEEVTSFSTDTQPSQNEKSIWGKKNDGTDGDVVHTIGAYYNASSGFAQGLNGYMAEIHWVEGAALAPTDFGEFDSASGIWIPKQYTGSHGTNGFYLDFEDSSNLGADASSNSNNWSLNNISAVDQSPDTPTNSYGTWNALFSATGANDGYPGGLKVTQGGTEAAGISGWDTALSTIAVSQGKWYAEFYITGSGTPVYTMIGAAKAERFDLVIKTGGVYVGHSGSSGYSVSLYGQNGATYPAEDDGGTANRFDAGDIISVALDMDNQKIYWARDGSWLLSDNPASNNGYAIPWTGDTYFGVSQYDSDNSLQANFGGFHANTVSSGNADANGYGNFEYAPPTGYYALNTHNLNEFG